MPHTTYRYSQPLNPHAPVFTPSSPNPSTPAFYSTIHPSNRLNVGHINICSLRHKTHVITKLIDEHCLDLLAVTETWLDSSISDTEVSVPGTILLRRDRPCADGCTCLSSCTPCRKGGGICIFVKEHVKGEVHPKIKISQFVDFEALSSVVKVPSPCDTPFWRYLNLKFTMTSCKMTSCGRRTPPPHPVTSKR